MSNTSKTETYEFEAMIKWAKVYEPDEAFGDTKWSVNAYLIDDRQWKLYERSGLQGVPKEDEDGKFVTFRRDTNKKIGKDFVEFTPPFIYDTDGTPLVQYKDKASGKNVYQFNVKDDIEYEQSGERVMIGNGTIAKIRVSVFSTMKGKGHRLENIKLVDLVEYKSNGRNYISADEVGLDEGPGDVETPAVDFSDLDTVPSGAPTDPTENVKPKTSKKASAKKDSDLPW